MSNKIDQSTEAWGLLATGRSGRWIIEVDEALDRDEWSLEIDGPQMYLVFQLRDLKVVPAALHFLRSGPPSRTRPATDAAFTLGELGSASVSLLWDNEDFPRCFLVVRPKARSTLRLSLDADDISMFIDALSQITNDIPQVPGE